MFLEFMLKKHTHGKSCLELIFLKPNSKLTVKTYY